VKESWGNFKVELQNLNAIVAKRGDNIKEYVKKYDLRLFSKFI
jgi:hypothetical protein